ncbi:hypothetical protein [Schleiferilactobacillus harbinensis]|uniref:hypothetical protein n=1 Tax=Schleiferilactobacillus harbinensis TaxID=304207 RepID=UPI0007B97F1C|nr:hypothetical protein [Schleiferilactobacillus harbinensis]
MKNNKTLGFGDMLIFSVIFLVLFRLTGVVSISWIAVYNFSIFVLLYLIIYFVIDVVVKVIDAVVAKRRDE